MPPPFPYRAALALLAASCASPSLTVTEGDSPVADPGTEAAMKLARGERELSRRRHAVAEGKRALFEGAELVEQERTLVTAGREAETALAAARRASRILRAEQELEIHRAVLAVEEAGDDGE